MSNHPKKVNISLIASQLETIFKSYNKFYHIWYNNCDNNPHICIEITCGNHKDDHEFMKSVVRDLANKYKYDCVIRLEQSEVDDSPNFSAIYTITFTRTSDNVRERKSLYEYFVRSSCKE